MSFSTIEVTNLFSGHMPTIRSKAKISIQNAFIYLFSILKTAFFISLESKKRVKHPEKMNCIEEHTKDHFSRLYLYTPLDKSP